MIFPILRGLLSPLRTPIVYTLFLMNVVVFLLMMPAFQESQKEMDAVLDNPQFLQTQGILFSQFIQHSPQNFSRVMRKLASETLLGEHDTAAVMGNLALRSNDFMSLAPKLKYNGDQVAFDNWREDFDELHAIEARHPSYTWGLSRAHHDWTAWVLYQFAHSGWPHLFWNMVFLLIFGVFTESIVGPMWTLITYVGAGFAGAASFSLLSGISSSPLVGASAAISGLMGFVIVMCWGQRVKFFFWLLPVRGYFGFVMLPAWVLAVVYILPDVSGYLSSVNDFQSVAYSAHIGGTLCGALVAMGLRYAGLLQPTAQSLDAKYFQLQPVAP